MNKAVKWAIGGALLVTAVAVVSKAKNALDKLSFRIAGFSFVGFTAGGLKVRFRSVLANDTAVSITAHNILSKLYYKSGNDYTEFGRADNIPSMQFPKGQPVNIDSVFTIAFTELPYLLRSDVFQIRTYYTIYGLEQKDVTDIKLTDLKKQAIAVAKTSPLVPGFIKTLLNNLSGLSAYDHRDYVLNLSPNQYRTIV